MIHINGGLAGEYFSGPEWKGCGNAASGTYYFSKFDYLTVDNAFIETERATVLSASIRDPDTYPGQELLADFLYVADHTHVLVRNDLISEILFPSLFMGPYSNMTFEINKAETLTIKYRSQFSVHATSILDFTKLVHGTKFKSVEM